jgi:hypothetical protein
MLRAACFCAGTWLVDGQTKALFFVKAHLEDYR